MNLAVVVAAKQQPVGQIGETALGPGEQMVGVGVCCGSAAFGEAAAVVPGRESFALQWAGGAGLAAEVERDAVGV
jgi:hypothetical protein